MCLYYEGQNKGRIAIYKEEYYDHSGKDGKRIKKDLKHWGFHHLTISSVPADVFRMSKSQLEKLFEHTSDAFIANSVAEYAEANSARRQQDAERVVQSI